MSQAPVIDAATIKKLRSLNQAGQPDLLAELAELFFKDSPGLIESAEGNLSAGDYDSLYKAVHRLKGSALYIGGTEMGTLCQDLMALAQEKKAQELEERIPELEPTYERLRAALEAEIQQ